MKEIIKIAWRNLWRNRRRTFITAGSIFFAIFFAVLMRSFQLGTYSHMIRQSIEAYSGYLQVQHPDYFDDPGIDNTFVYTTELDELVNKHPNVKVAVPRIESFALASAGSQSKEVLVSGISPAKELAMSNPSHKLVCYKLSPQAVEKLTQSGTLPDEIIEKIRQHSGASFTTKEQIGLELGLTKSEMKYADTIAAIIPFPSAYLDENDNGVLISDRLSKYLMLTVGDTLVLLGQGFHGVSAAGVFPIRGIVKIPSPDLDNKLVYMTLANADRLFGLENRITSFAINLYDTKKMEATQKEISTSINPQEYIVKNWEEVMPVMKQQIEGDSISGLIFLGILYVIIFFGIFGTVLMMISERMREFGVMVAIGMKQVKLSTVLLVEMLFLGMLGAVTGMAASIPFILYGYYHPFKMTGKIAQMYIDYGFDPVMPMAWFDSYFFLQGLVILFMVVLASLFTVKSIMKLNVIKALRG